MTDTTISTAYTQMGDDQLSNLVCQGNHDAFSVLVTRHTAVCLNLARRTLNNNADADDVVQLVFVKYWQNPTLWNPNKSRLSTWLYTVTLNACRDWIRKHAKHSAQDISNSFEPQADDLLTDFEAQTESHEKKRRLNIAISSLPSMQRDAINLAMYTLLPQREIAAVLGVSIKALESLLMRAKKALAQKLATPMAEAEL